MNTAQAIDAFYVKNGYATDGGASKAWAKIKVGSISFPIPNLPARSQNLYLHDVNHVVMGFETTWKGESAISSWEIATGGWGKLYFVWLLVLGGMGVGVVFYPKSTYDAFQAGLNMRSAFTSGLSKNQLYSLSLDELKSILQSQPSDLQNQNYLFWCFASLSVWLVPLFLTTAILLLGK